MSQNGVVSTEMSQNGDVSTEMSQNGDVSTEKYCMLLPNICFGMLNLKSNLTVKSIIESYQNVILKMCYW